MGSQPTTTTTAVAGHKKGRVPRPLRERQLLDIAQELFLSKGYDATSIENICRMAGISRPIVYDHFASKGAIYLACVRRARATLEEAITKAAASTSDPEAQLLRSGDAYFQILEDDPRRWALLFGRTGILGELGDELAAERLRTVETIATLLRGYAPNADPDRLSAYATLISGSSEQLGCWWLHNQHIPRQTIARYNAHFIWSGARHLATKPDHRNSP